MRYIDRLGCLGGYDPGLFPMMGGGISSFANTTVEGGATLMLTNLGT